LQGETVKFAGPEGSYAVPVRPFSSVREVVKLWEVRTANAGAQNVFGFGYRALFTFCLFNDVASYIGYLL
jgi:hypothetical protein